MTIETVLSAFFLALVLAEAASAAAIPMSSAEAIGQSNGSIIQVGEGCGANRWRGSNGGCHVFTNPYGSNRGTAAECPPGFHFAPNFGRCFPNR